MTPNSCWCKLVKYWPSLIRGLFLSWTRPCTSLLGCGGVGDGWFKEGWRGLFLAASASSGATNLTPAKALWFSVLSPSWTFKTVKLSLLHVYYSWAAHTFCPLHSLCSHHGSQCLAPWSIPPGLGSIEQPKGCQASAVLIHRKGRRWAPGHQSRLSSGRHPMSLTSPLPNISLNGESLEIVTLNSGVTQGPPLSLLFNIILEVLANKIIKNKWKKDWNIKCKTDIVDNIIIIQNSRESVDNLLEINKLLDSRLKYRN